MSAVLKQAEIPVTADLSIVEPATTREVALKPAQRAAIALDAKATERRLVRLVKQSVAIQSVTNGDGRDECHSAAMLLRSTKVGIKAIGKTAREDAQAFSKSVIAEENRLVLLIEPEEKRLLALRDAYDEKVEREEQERIAKEVARTDAIEHRIKCIRDFAASCASKSSSEIQTLISMLDAIDINEESFAEFIDGATQAKAETKIAMNTLLMDAIEREDAEAARLAAIAEEKAKLAAEREALRIEREATAAIAAQAKVIADAEAAKVKAEAEAAAAKLREEQAEFARQKAELEARFAEMRRMQEAMNPVAVIAPEVNQEESKGDIPDPDFSEVGAASDQGDVVDATFVQAAIEQGLEVAPLTPTADDLINLVMDYYGESYEVARGWLIKIDFNSLTQKA